MHKNFINKLMIAMLVLIASIGAYAGKLNVHAEEKYPLYLNADYALTLGEGHVLPGQTGQMGDLEEKFKNLTITIEDEQGNVTEVKKELDIFARRFGGNFAAGQKFTITIDETGLPEGYCLSYQDAYTYPAKAKSYAKFTVTYNPGNSKNMYVRIPFCMQKVKFDLQGGEVNGNTGPLFRTVNKDNKVDFPANPTKENFTFSGWYTETPDIEAYRQRNMVGKRFYWDQDSLFPITTVTGSVGMKKL